MHKDQLTDILRGLHVYIEGYWLARMTLIGSDREVLGEQKDQALADFGKVCLLAEIGMAVRQEVIPVIAVDGEGKTVMDYRCPTPKDNATFDEALKDFNARYGGAMKKLAEIEASEKLEQS